MVALTWAVSIVVAALGLLPSPARIPRHRVVLAVIGFAVLAAAFVVYGFVINDEFPSKGEMVAMVLLFSLSAALGYLFGGSAAALILGTDRRATGAAGKIGFVLATLVLGAAFFVSASYLAIHYVNTGYMSFLELGM